MKAAGDASLPRIVLTKGSGRCFLLSAHYYWSGKILVLQIATSGIIWKLGSASAHPTLLHIEARGSWIFRRSSTSEKIHIRLHSMRPKALSCCPLAILVFYVRSFDFPEIFG